MRNVLQHIRQIPRKSVAAVISFYQQTLSPDHGPLRHLYDYGYCRHEPTCSEYGKQVILRDGVLIGVPKTIWRILHCNPFAKPSAKRVQKLLRDASH